MVLYNDECDFIVPLNVFVFGLSLQIDWSMGCPQTVVGVARSSPPVAGAVAGAEFEARASGGMQMPSSTCGKSVICPAPRRPIRTAHPIDASNKVARKPKSPVAYNGQPEGLEFMYSFLNQGELEDDSDNRVGFFLCSPPVRTHNPLVRDSQFGRRACPYPTVASISISPTGRKISLAGKPPKRTGVPTVSGDRKQKPRVRIEGFACDNVDPDCSESAPASPMSERES